MNATKVRVVVVVCIPVCILGFILLYFFMTKNKETPQSAETPFAKQNQTLPAKTAPATQSETNLTLDSDNDGLRDWEEVLWKTDSKIADGDGDGTNDGDEVKAGRNPTIKGPKDTLSDSVYRKPPAKQTEIPIATFSSSSAEYKLPVLTPKIAASSTATPLPTSKIDPAPPILSPEKITLKLFGNTLATVLIHRISDMTSGARALENTTKKPTLKDFEDLTTLKNSYTSLAREVASVNTPDSGAVLHQTLANNYRDVSSGLEILIGYQNTLSVPATSFGSYSNAVIATGNTLLGFIDFFQKEGITFEKNEPGYIFSGSI